MKCEPGCGLFQLPSRFQFDSRNAEGKPAGVRCVQLDEEPLSFVWRSITSDVCHQFKADPDICGGEKQAMANLIELERIT